MGVNGGLFAVCIVADVGRLNGRDLWAALLLKPRFVAEAGRLPR